MGIENRQKVIKSRRDKDKILYSDRERRHLTDPLNNCRSELEHLFQTNSSQLTLSERSFAQSNHSKCAYKLCVFLFVCTAPLFVPQLLL